DVRAPEACLEALDVAAVQRPDERVGEGFDGRVADGEAGAVAQDVVADRVEERGLADAGRPVDEEGVVRLAGRLRHREGGRMGEAVGVADHEGLERQAPVDAVAFGGLRCRRFTWNMPGRNDVDSRLWAEDCR